MVETTVVACRFPMETRCANGKSAGDTGLDRRVRNPRSPVRELVPGAGLAGVRSGRGAPGSGDRAEGPPGARWGGYRAVRRPAATPVVVRRGACPGIRALS
ncbi:hypothetical protein GCM10022222_52730 [Amycolatopsis ultiminotia]|uniref:Uncharacterized protein n=1 Tax=Amycolatopsis ultiminotia TaxID=543629 RepID=A0ABP6X769_9PSEU